MTEEQSRLSRRALLGAGFVLPVTFVSGAQASPMVRMAYDDQSGNGQPDQGNAYQQLQDTNGGNVQAPPTPDAAPVSPDDNSDNSGSDDNSDNSDNSDSDDNSDNSDNSDSDDNDDNSGTSTDDSTGSAQVPVQLNPGTSNATPQDNTPVQNQPAAPADSSLQQLKNMNNGENQNSAFDNGSRGDNATTNTYTPVVPETPPATPVPLPPQVTSDPTYQALSAQAQQAQQTLVQAQQSQTQADTAWDAVKANPNAEGSNLTTLFDNKRKADSAAVWAKYQSQQAQDKVQDQINTITIKMQNPPGQK